MCPQVKRLLKSTLSWLNDNVGARDSLCTWRDISGMSLKYRKYFLARWRLWRIWGLKTASSESCGVHVHAIVLKVRHHRAHDRTFWKDHTCVRACGSYPINTSSQHSSWPPNLVCWSHSLSTQCLSFLSLEVQFILETIRRYWCRLVFPGFSDLISRGELH